MLELESGDYSFFQAYKRGKKPLFFKVHDYWHCEIFDELHDLGYRVSRIEKWYYYAQTDQRHPEKVDGGKAFDIDWDDNDMVIRTWKKNLRTKG
jgi:hypothetical protein